MPKTRLEFGLHGSSNKSDSGTTTTIFTFPFWIGVCPIIGDFIVTYKGQKIYEFCAQISGNAPHAHFILEKDILLKIKLIFISKILPSRRFIPIVITLSQCPITIPDCRLNSRIPRFSWPLYQSYDAPDKSTTRRLTRWC